jgi:hypothetical protein
MPDVKLLPSSKLAHTVARHILNHGTQTKRPPRGVTAASYRGALARLEKSGVLRRWQWDVDGVPYEPKSHTAGWLWLPGPQWEQYLDAAEDAGIEFERVEEL